MKIELVSICSKSSAQEENSKISKKKWTNDRFLKLDFDIISNIFSKLSFSDLISLSFTNKEMKQKVDKSIIIRSNEVISKFEKKLNLDIYSNKENKKLKGFFKKSKKNLDSIADTITIFLSYKDKVIDVVSERFPKEKNIYAIAKAKLIVHGIEQFKRNHAAITFEHLVCSSSKGIMPCQPFYSTGIFYNQKTTNPILYDKAYLLMSALQGKPKLSVEKKSETYRLFHPSFDSPGKIELALQEIAQAKSSRSILSYIKRQWDKDLLYEGIKESILKMDEISFQKMVKFLSNKVYEFSYNQKKELIFLITSNRRDLFLDIFLKSNLWKSNIFRDQYKSHEKLISSAEYTNNRFLFYWFLTASVYHDNWEYFKIFWDKSRQHNYKINFSELIDICYNHSNSKFIINILKNMNDKEIKSLKDKDYRKIFYFYDEFFKENHLEGLLENGLFSLCKKPTATVQRLVNTYLHTNQKVLFLLHEYEQIDLLDDSFLLKKYKEAPNEMKQFLIPKTRNINDLIESNPSNTTQRINV